MKEVNPKDFANAIMQDLTEITDSMIVNVKKATDEVAMEAKDVIDSHITFNDYGRKGITPGKYRRSFKLKTVSETSTGKSVTWYASGREYALTHLLEYGHVKRGGKGRTRAYPHISYGWQYVKDNLPKRIEEALKNAK